MESEKRIMRSKSSGRGVAALGVLFFSLLGQAQAAWVGAEGEMWLKWEIATRNAYVYAYTAGILRGFTAGCNAGIDYLSSKRKYKADEAEDYLAGCSSNSPVKLTRIDDGLTAQAVTAFYAKYPKQRFLNVSDILLKLLAGHTIDQIHREFPESDDPKKK
jgi:hypothetical protein